LSEVQLQVPVGGCCGRCLSAAQEVVEEHQAQASNCCKARAA
jgi:bacterioferritin-associated ferredoxin